VDVIILCCLSSNDSAPKVDTNSLEALPSHINRDRTSRYSFRIRSLVMNQL
jgi:hypothetical protein